MGDSISDECWSTRAEFAPTLKLFKEPDENDGRSDGLSLEDSDSVFGRPSRFEGEAR